MMFSKTPRSVLLGCITGTLLLLICTLSTITDAFQIPSATTRFPSGRISHHQSSGSIIPSLTLKNYPKEGIVLYSANDDDDGDSLIASSDQLLLGGLGTFASLVTFYSEYTLFTTGCGLPAGPFGLVGLVEGLSYLGMLGIVSYSVVTKVRTGSGLPAGPFGLLGAAEGLSFLAILAGLVVLVSQLTNYGYIPNAVPMEGGMCS